MLPVATSAADPGAHLRRRPRAPRLVAGRGRRARGGHGRRAGRAAAAGRARRRRGRRAHGADLDRRSSPCCRRHAGPGRPGRRRAWPLAGSLSELVLADLREEVVDRALAVPLDDVERAGTGDLVARACGDVDAVSEAIRAAVPEILASALLIGCSPSSAWRPRLAAGARRAGWRCPSRSSPPGGTCAGRARLTPPSGPPRAAAPSSCTPASPGPGRCGRCASARPTSAGSTTRSQRDGRPRGRPPGSAPGSSRAQRRRAGGPGGDPGRQLPARARRHHHGRRGDRGRAVLPPAVRPDRHAALPARHRPGGVRRPRPPGRRRHLRWRRPDAARAGTGARPSDTSVELKGVHFAYDDGPPVLPTSTCASRPASGWRSSGASRRRQDHRRQAGGRHPPRRRAVRCASGAAAADDLGDDQLGRLVTLVSQEVHVFAGPPRRRPAPGPARRHRRRAAGRPRPRGRLAVGRGAARAGSTPSSATAATSWAPPRPSSWRWPGWCWPIPRSPCSTRPPPRPAARAPAPSRRPRPPPSPAAPPWWSPTGSPRRWRPTASSCSTPGRVVEQGTHDELLAAGGAYAALWAAWSVAR